MGSFNAWSTLGLDSKITNFNQKLKKFFHMVIYGSSLDVNIKEGDVRMRKLNRGENLTKDELKEIASNYKITLHAKIRMAERGISEQSVKQVILNPKVAYFNTDGSINVAKDKDHYFVVSYDKSAKKYVIITYKEPSRNGKDIFDKQAMAIMGLKRAS